MFLQQQRNATMPSSAALLQELERLKQRGYSQNSLMVEVSANHSVLCNEKLFVPHIDKNKPVTWVFAVKSSSRVSKWCRLRRVFLLDPYLPEYSIAQVKASNNPEIILPVGSQEWELNSGSPVTTYQITLRFESADYGSFQQRLVFDFAEQPLVFRQLEVVVAPEQSLLHAIQYPVVCDEDSELSWLAKYQVVSFDPQDVQGQTNSEFPLPPNLGTALEIGHFDHLDDSLSREQYRQRLHMLLHIEEYERRHQMTRLTIHCTDLLHCLQPCATDPAQVTIVLPIDEALMDDATLLISRGGYALVRIKPHGRPHLVLYEVVVESLRKNRVLLRASSELQQVFKSARRSPLPASVCFRFVDTYQHMHWAVERVSLDVVFPIVKEGSTDQWSIPSNRYLLNNSQCCALKQMLLPHPGPPLLILGPFGTGKTRTIAEAIKELIITQLNSRAADHRILLCTHSNSAADHYIKNYLHPFLTESQIPRSRFKPLRICWENRFISTVPEEVLQYCLLDLHTGKFAIPSKEVLQSHRVVVTTLVTAASLAKLDLPPGFFTHIFIDEAAQAMEAETIIPLCLAGPNTQLVLAGDHLQLSPPVLSTVCRQLGLGRSLLVRLYELYPSMSTWKVLLLQNYRAYDDIVEVPSHLFYQDTLIANMKRPPSLPYSVVFHGVHGKEEIADEPPSFLNRGEAAEVADRVEELINRWPTDVWGDANPARICVLAPYAPQVREIRRLLRSKSLGGVQVEGVNNVQGLEFDVLFISTVRTYQVNTTNQKNLGFLSDCKLLNTAITRARYRLVVIGDPQALCSLGECRVCWKTILSKCSSNGTFNYRLPFDTVIKMSKDARNEISQQRMSDLPNGPTAVPPCNNIMNAAPGTLNHYLPQAGIPFVTMQQSSAILPGRLPVYLGNPGPLVIPRQAVPFPMHSVPIVPNPFQQNPLINGFAPLVTVSQGMGFHCPLAPWAANQEMLPDTTAVKTLSTGQQMPSNTAPVRTLATDQQQVPNASHMGVHQREGGKSETLRVASTSSGVTTHVPSHLSYGRLRETRERDQAEVERQQSRPSPNLIVPNESQKKLLSLLESNLNNRQEMMARERDLLARLRISFHSPAHQVLQENLEEQVRIEEKEAELLQRHIDQYNALKSLLTSEDPGSADVSGDGDDVSEEESSCPNLSSWEGGYTEDDYEDSDADEWFSAQQKDPIVQDYIKAFEKLTSRNDLDDDQNLSSPESAMGNTHCDTTPLVNESSLASVSDGQEVTPLQGWVLQPSESAVYIESYSINEEHLGKEEAQSRVAAGELVACRLQMDSFSDGNTATAKICDPNSPDIHISNRVDMNRAFHGDTVAVEVINADHQGSGNPQGRVRAILEENHPRKVVCRLDDLDKNMMTPINRSNSKFVILQSKDHQGQTGVAVFAMKGGQIHFKSFVTETEGKLFVVQLMKWGARYRHPLGFVVHYFANGGDPQMSIPVLLAEHGVHKEHSKKIQNEAKKDFPPRWKIPLSERVKRVLFPEVFSIDAASCLEIDDALSVCWEYDGTYKVGVHIADVSFFVAKDSNLDKAAFSHVASVYGSTEASYHSPMLPPYVGTQLCSLLPNEEKLAVSVIFHLNEDGVEVESPEIHRSIVKSCCKLTYEQCQDVLDGIKLDDISESVQKGIGILGQLSFKMWARRVRQGYVSFDADVSNSGVLSSSKMVEEFMIQTNHAVAKRLLQSPLAKKLVPLRRQLSPKTHLLRDIYDSCVDQGMEPGDFFCLHCLTTPCSREPDQRREGSVSIDLKTWEKISAALDEKDFGKVTVSVLHHENKSGVGKVLSQLASTQENSVYVVSSTLSTDLQGHFALNLPSYTHFTSPIRRYVDIVVHRILLAVLGNIEIPYTEEQVQNICGHCQTMSVRIDAFEKQFAAVSRADALRNDSRWRLAKVDSLSSDNLLLGGDEVDHIGSFYRCIRIRDCKPSSREWLEEEEELVLSWNVLEINVTGQAIKRESNEDNFLCVSSSSSQFEASSGVSRQFLKIPQEFWAEFLQGLRDEDLLKMNQQRHMIDTNAVVSFDKTHLSNYVNDSPEESIAMTSLALHQDLSAHTKFYRRRDAIPVSLGAEVNRGLLRPSILAVKFSDTIVCCMRHRRHPMKSFGIPPMTATKTTYADVRDYQKVMLPLLECEAAAASVNSDSTIQVILQNVSVQWDGNIGQLALPKALCICHGLQLSSGDFLCLRSNVSPCILHCCVNQVDSNHERDLIYINLVEFPDGFSVDALNEDSYLYSVEVIARGQAFRRMISAVKSLGTAPELIRGIFLRRDIPVYLAQNPMLKEQREVETMTTTTLNPGQEEAVKFALSSPLTLIQGPPGTGKTLTGVEVACQFVALNRRQGTGGQVLFCASSNHAVDVAARMLEAVPGVKVLRVYGRTIEDQTFKQSLRTTLWTSQSTMDTACKDISLHFRIRESSNPHSSRIAAAEEAIMQLRKKTTSHASTTAKDQERDRSELCRVIQELYGAVDDGERYEIAESGTEVIMCTCIEAGGSRVKRHGRVSHVVVDEASMCLEAETLVALAAAGQRLQQVVLLGDHKQLGAVITCSAPRKLGLGKSLFEELFDENATGKTYSSCMLQTQYRMHPSIREFPSQHFYGGLLKDASHLTSPDHLTIGHLPGFWAGGPEVRVVFCHVMGSEESPQDYTGPEGREESKHNPQEVQTVIRVLRNLISRGVKSSQISVLTPYSAQRAKISRALQAQMSSCDSEVLSVFASQGAERDFIVLSTVRSMPPDQIVSGSTDNQQWLASHLGFLIDERQMNVALTRAKHGLIIVGNRHLLAVHRMWSSLISHCQRLGCLVAESWLTDTSLHGAI